MYLLNFVIFIIFFSREVSDDVFIFIIGKGVVGFNMFGSGFGF